MKSGQAMPCRCFPFPWPTSLFLSCAHTHQDLAINKTAVPGAPRRIREKIISEREILRTAACAYLAHAIKGIRRGADMFSMNGEKANFFLQEALLTAGVSFTRQLNPIACSHLGAFVARTIGPTLAASRVARRNLAMAFPELDVEQREAIMRDAWDNLGRVIAEFPHLPNFMRTSRGPGWEITGEEHIAAASRQGKPPLFFSAHFGNWELILPIADALGINVGVVYRAASNPAVDKVIQAVRRRAGPEAKMFPKGRRGAKAILAHLSANGALGLLVDQKMNDGIEAPFFGHVAWTAPALAQLAARFKRNIVPVHVVRIGPVRYRLVCEAALEFVLTGDRKIDEKSIMSAVNQHIERWIEDKPSLWLWFHQRWPKDISPFAKQ